MSVPAQRPAQASSPEDECKDMGVPEESTNGQEEGHIGLAGVKGIAQINAQLSTGDRVWFYAAVFLAAYVGGLDYVLRYTYQGYATGSFGLHSLLATVNIVINVVSAVAQPLTATLSDFFGRFELYLAAVFFYTIGTILQATATNIEAYCAGAVLYQLGFSMSFVLFLIIIADISNLNHRLFFTLIPLAPTLVNSWVSGDITEAVLGNTTWEWGVGMFGIIYPVCALPLVMVLFIGRRRAKRVFGTTAQVTRVRGMTFAEMLWRFDVVGVILLVAAWALFLVPFTLAGEQTSLTPSEQWKKVHILVPLVFGVICFPAFGYWEAKFARHPIMPIHVVKDRGVWGGLVIGVLFNLTYMIQSDYLYAQLFVSFDQTVKSSTRISNLWTFCSNTTGLLAGLLVFKVRRVKPFIVAGTALFVAAFGLLMHFRSHSRNVSAMIGAQVLLGIGGGLFVYPTMTAVQARTKHEHVAIVSGLYYGASYFGVAIGSAISGAIWTSLMPGQLHQHLDALNATLADMVFADPYTMIYYYPVGTPEREGMVESYGHVQRLLCLTGLCFSIIILLSALVLRDTVLVAEQSRRDAEEMSLESEGSTDGLSKIFRRWWR